LILIPRLACKKSVHHHSNDSGNDHQWRRNKVVVRHDFLDETYEWTIQESN
jgi:hypothetical protein